MIDNFASSKDRASAHWAKTMAEQIVEFEKPAWALRSEAAHNRPTF